MEVREREVFWLNKGILWIVLRKTKKEEAALLSGLRLWLLTKSKLLIIKNNQTGSFYLALKKHWW